MELPNTELEVFLMQRAGQGDRGSFEQLYERFSGVLFSTAYHVVGNQQTAEDVLQEVFVAIWEKAPMYDSGRGKPLTWAVTLTRHKAIDKLRSIQRKGALHERAEQEAKVVEDHQTSMDEVELAEKSKIVRAAVRELPAPQRKAIELAYFNGMSQSEIAAQLGEPLGTVKARIRRGMMRLRELVEPRL